MLLFFSVLLYVGCSSSNDKAQPEAIVQQVESINNPSLSKEDTALPEPEPEPEPKPVPEPELEPEPDFDLDLDLEAESDFVFLSSIESLIEDLIVEIYGDDTSKPLDEEETLSIQDDINSIVIQAATYFIKEYSYIPGHEMLGVTVYMITPMEAWIVLLDHDYNGCPKCSMFTYSGKQLSSYDFSINRSLAALPMGYNCASEVKPHYGDGFPFVVFEVSAYYGIPGKGIGAHNICRLDDDGIEIIWWVDLNEWHYTVWGDHREYFADTSLGEEEVFACNFENWRQDITFSCINDDGYVEIILSGLFQCVTMDGDIIISENAVDVFVYNDSTGFYEYCDELSIKSPLRQFWRDGR